MDSLNDGPPSITEYGTIDPSCPQELIDCMMECHDEMTIKQLRSCADFFNKKADDLRRVAEEEVTIEQFEKAKKQDIDNDQEEGEY